MGAVNELSPRAKTGEAEIADFIGALGARVRAARLAAGLSRRVLSERSGVSQRYLAQIESGAGNISVARLFRVAQALDRPVEALLGGGPVQTAETARLVALLQAAGPDQRRRALQMLRADKTLGRKSRLCLIGLRGAGKSTLGRMAGAALGLPFREINRDIEAACGMHIGEVMALYGTEGYRRLERHALERVVAETDAVVLAVAGGIVSEPRTYGYLLRQFHTVWLKANPYEHMERVRAQGDERPMAGNPKAMEDLVGILTSREALYAKAGHSVDTSGRGVEESLRDLMEVAAGLGLPPAV